jgi:predicted HTH domain antitoxin
LGASVANILVIYHFHKYFLFLIMQTVTLNIPDNVDIDSNEVAMLVASKLYEQGKLSLGQAAEIAGLTKRTFAELLGRYNVSIFNYPSSDLARDVSNA